MYQPQPNRGNRFFAWIRSSRITRGRNRWIAGVCDGVARRLGWNATLVRALVILTSLLFGAGAAFYALAWFLLPDETDGRILCEELVNGHWDWNCAGALVCAAVALCLPGAGWLAFGVAVLVFWLLVNRQSYAASWQPPQGGSWPGQPAQPVQPGQPVRPAQSQYMPQPMSTNTATTANMPGTPGQPMPQPTCPAPSGYQQYARPVQSPYQTFQQPVNPPAAFAAANVPPTFTAPPTVAAPQSKRARRKPAGPLLVLVTLGLALLAIAGSGWYAITMPVDWDYALRVLRLATLCCGGICLGIGVVIVVLGCMGRRTGGLHPLAWCAAFMAVVMTFCTSAVAWESRDWMMSNDYHRTTVSGIVTWSDTSDAQMKRYEQGLVVVGKNYANDVLDIDLSGYPAAHGKHKVKLNDGTYGESSCPTGKLNLVVVNAQVVVTLPDGCQWSVSDPDDGYTNVTDYIGGPDGITFFNGTGFMGLSLDENDDSGLGHHGVNKGVPALNGTTDFDDSGDDDAGDAGFGYGERFAGFGIRRHGSRQGIQNDLREQVVLAVDRFGQGSGGTGSVCQRRWNGRRQCHHAVHVRQQAASGNDGRPIAWQRRWKERREKRQRKGNEMSDEKTREVPLTDVMGIAEVSDEPTETLPAVDDPGEAKTESFQKPFDGGPEAQRKFESQDEAESLETSGQDMRGSFAGRSARPTGSVKSADPAKSAEPVDPSKQVRIGKTDGELVIRPSGPSTGTIVLGVFFCLIGLMSMLCLLPIGAWRWMPNPSTLFFYVVGGLGALLLIISVVWAVVAAVRLRRRERQSAEQSPESQQRQR